MQRKIEVSVIVVHYGHGNEVFKCLDGLKIIKNKFKSIEFILVDNNDEKLQRLVIKKKYPWIKYLAPDKNLGWGGGRNFGIKNCTGKYILSLDSDVVIDSKSFKNIYEILKKNKDVGIVSPQIKYFLGNYSGGATKELTPIRGIFYLSFLNKIFPYNPVVKKYLISEWDKKTSRNVEVAQFAGFMIKKKAYDEIGGFDENFFLYFEENDVANRLRKKGWKIFFDSKSEVLHLESKGTPKKSVEVSQVFAESRFLYFKKHYGILQALLVESFARFSKYTLMMIGILLLGTILRFYKLPQNMYFNGEMGYDYMTIRDFVEKGQIPLVGPRTSHEWFFIGPLFYWIFGILLPLFNYNVAVGAYFFAMVGVLSIWICYLTIKSLFGQRTAIISSFLISFSPLWIQATRDARFNVITPFLFFPFYYFLAKSIENRGKSFFALGLTLGIMFSFFPSPILLLPGALVVIYLYRKSVDKKYFASGILGLIIPNIPYLIYNTMHNFEILRNLFIWIPYRIFGFFGLYPKNSATPQVLQKNLTGLYTFFQQSYLFDNNILILVLSASVLIFSLTKFKKNISLRILLILAGISYVGLFLHGAPPQHYYLVIFPVPIILLSLFLEKMFVRRLWIPVLILTCLMFFNLKFYFSKDWFFVNSVKVSEDLNFVPFSLQLKIADYIASDAGYKSFSIARVGPLDYFNENFSLNYQYLLRNLNKKTDKTAALRYTIYEDTSNLPRNEKIHWIENIAVIKNEQL